MRFVKVRDKYLNADEIVCITEDEQYYNLRMTNGDCYKVGKEPVYKKMIKDILSNK